MSVVLVRGREHRCFCKYLRGIASMVIVECSRPLVRIINKMTSMENKEYVFVTINKEADGMQSTFTTITASVSIDAAREFLQKYKDEQTAPLI